MSRAAFVQLIRLALLRQYPSEDNGSYDAMAEMSVGWMEKKMSAILGAIGFRPFWRT